MRVSRQDRDYALDFLMKSNSLNDLLGILKNICENLDLSYLNPRIKHFRYFQFTFFGLMVKAKGLLDMMLYRSEFLESNIPDFGVVHAGLKRLRKSMEKAYSLINNKDMEKGKNEIIKVADEYSGIFEMIVKLVK